MLERELGDLKQRMTQGMLSIGGRLGGLEQRIGTSEAAQRQLTKQIQSPFTEDSKLAQRMVTALADQLPPPPLSFEKGADDQLTIKGGSTRIQLKDITSAQLWTALMTVKGNTATADEGEDRQIYLQVHRFVKTVQDVAQEAKMPVLGGGDGSKGYFELPGVDDTLREPLAKHLGQRVAPPPPLYLVARAVPALSSELRQVASQISILQQQSRQPTYPTHAQPPSPAPAPSAAAVAVAAAAPAQHVPPRSSIARQRPALTWASSAPLPHRHVSRRHPRCTSRWQSRPARWTRLFQRQLPGILHPGQDHGPARGQGASRHEVPAADHPLLRRLRGVYEGLGITAYHLRKDCPNAPRPISIQSTEQPTGSNNNTDGTHDALRKSLESSMHIQNFAQGLGRSSWRPLTAHRISAWTAGGRLRPPRARAWGVNETVVSDWERGVDLLIFRPLKPFYRGNYDSLFDFWEAVLTELTRLITKGFVEPCTHRPFIVNPLGVVEKKRDPGDTKTKVRLILDCRASGLNASLLTPHFTLLSPHHTSINFRELLAILFAAQRWAREWGSHLILIRSDNTAAVG
ncbi:unnamed protein product [Vitrella brassicaformis CCMP3155]|uniref:Uncharacterized protein n=1 Tax=Vitrella brassicaformis (strain CCMP3155) TaxID=1169540 RepID=A0A0G4GXD3_VITBC|nr:unnamed protein product [Vitrella brassicaformis CCMP3155]|eukprot:CEM35723.1 unnamed protein product [Vitrella brassicaformis CCMP3155]